MPTKNLVSDFGAVGDGQVNSSVTITVSSSSALLTVGTAIFNPATVVGQTVAVWNGSNYKRGVVQASPTPTSTTVTLNSNFAWNATASSSKIVWGTDNTNAIRGASGSWRAYAQTQTTPADPPILQVPDGFYCWRGEQNDGNYIHFGVSNNPKITGISGNAAACGMMQLEQGEFRFGTNPGIVNVGLDATSGTANSVRLLTALSGSSTVTVANPSTTPPGSTMYGSRVVVGRAAIIACFDLQGTYNSYVGAPPNQFFYEWRTIIGYDSGTGIVTLDTPLTQDYKSTYPEFGIRNTTLGNDQGGAATMWITPDGFNTTVTLENMTLVSVFNQMACNIRNVVLNNIVCVGPGLYPTVNDTFTSTDSTWEQDLEVDKVTGTVTWNNPTLTGLVQQSTSPRYTYINGGTMQRLRGGRYFEANNVVLTGEARLDLGVGSHGRQDRAVISNVSGIAIFSSASVTTDDLDGQVVRANASDFYPFVSGVLKVLRSENDTAGSSGQANYLRALVPGTWVSFDDKFYDRVVDVTDDGTYCYIQFANTTSWPYTVARLKDHPCPDFTLTSCTGTAPQLEDYTGATPRIPLYSRAKRTYTKALAPGNTVQPFVLGNLTATNAMSINVTTAYTGTTQATLTWKPTQFF